MTSDEFARTRNVSRETLDRLKLYADKLVQWNSKINLVSSSTLPQLWTRHFSDSAQLIDLAEPNARNWVDIGSGGGFPGMIIAILAAEVRPNLIVTCVESDQRKAAFLKTVIRETGIQGRVESKRIEDLSPLRANVLSARALAPLRELLGFADQHLAPEGHALFPKGANARLELVEALEYWSFQADTYPSVTDANAVILKIGEIRRA